jgi:hypothetical protein
MRPEHAGCSATRGESTRLWQVWQEREWARDPAGLLRSAHGRDHEPQAKCIRRQDGKETPQSFV